ncbi:MAG: SOS response-associated peptidase family protein [Pseudomonadota bacterium]
MCVNYTPSRKELIGEKFDARLNPDLEWKSETWQDYAAPIILHDKNRQRQALVGIYSMVPKAKMPPGVKRFSTMNARAETIHQLRSYAKPWREGLRCLVPMQDFFEPNYESGKAERWRIGLRDESDFAVAGLYQIWPEENGVSYSFTQLTINADQHPLMRRFHKPGEEKRSLVILHKNDYDAWLSCGSPAQAQAFLQLYPAESMRAEAVRNPSAKPASQQLNLLDFD